MKDRPRGAAVSITVLNLGCGIQSTWLRLNVPHDVAIFADTQGEPDWVYSHLRWLQAQPGPPLMVVSAGNLEQDLLRGENLTGQCFITIPAYTATIEGQKVGIVRRQCTKNYKITPIQQAIRREVLGLKPRQHIPKGVTVRQLYGISLEEAGRARRIVARMDKGTAIQATFPLIELGMTRADCQRALESIVPHPVRKSSCVFCPFRRDRGWLELRELEPQSWGRAVRLDARLRESGVLVNRRLGKKLYLHDSCLPLDQVALKNENQMSLFHAECWGGCGL